MIPLGRRGGVFFRMFFALFFVSAGALGWFYWKNRRLPSLNEIKRTGSGAAREVEVLADRVVQKQDDAVPITKDSRPLCAWLASHARESLVRQGLKESDVLKSYNVERRKDGVLWVEQTLEVRRPAGFRPDVFRREIGRLAKSKGLAFLRDEKAAGKWTLEVGYKDRVFERLVLHDKAG